MRRPGGFRRLAWLVAVCVLAGCGSAASGSSTQRPPAGLRSATIRSGGRTRTYLIYVPSAAKDQPLPLVLVFHGANQSAAGAAATVDLLHVAERRHNMIVAFLQGYKDTWNEGAGDTPARHAGVDDVAFTAAVLHAIEARYKVDRQRIAATGLSNGALLTELLGCSLAANLTLIAPVEGQLPVSVSERCRPSEPISVYEVHGTDDQAIPYGGGHFNGVGGGTTVLSAPASARRWATLNHCAASGRRSHSGAVTFDTYGGCRAGVTVTLASIKGGQHQWPADFGQSLSSVLSSLSGQRRAVEPAAGGA